MSFEPEYESYRHGGWYVMNVRYPSGAVGCVSRNYADKKWRIVCSVDQDQTFPNRDAAARAEHDLALAEWDAVRQQSWYDDARKIAAALPLDLLRRTASFAHTPTVLRVACKDHENAVR